MKVTAAERGLVRLFAVDLPREKLDAFNSIADPTNPDQSDWPLRDALGAETLNPQFVEYFDVADLEEVGLSGYMVQGLGIAKKDVTEDALRLNAISGQVLIALSSAFGGVSQNLTPKAPLRWIGTYSEEGSEVAFAPLPSASAKGGIASPPPAVPATNPHLTVLWVVLSLPIFVLMIGAIIYGVTR